MAKVKPERSLPISQLEKEKKKKKTVKINYPL